MNLAWLLGFTSFLIGSCLFPITLGVWWEGRYRLSPRASRPSSALLCVGYFCHLVSLGLTVVGIGRSVGGGPGAVRKRRPWKFRIARLARTSISFVPLLVLGYFYLQAARRSGPLRPVWENLSNPWSPSAWGARLGWVDPITLAVKDGLPFTSRVSPGFVVFAPVVWLTVGLVLWWYGRITSRPRARPRSARSMTQTHQETIADAREHETTGRAGSLWQLCFWSEESSDQTPSARPMENSCRSGCCSWA